MAKFDIEKHLISDDVYIVSKDDWSKTRRFTDRTEAEAYYESLKREEVEDSIAKNQAEAVEQNKKIIENQERIINAQEKQQDRPHNYRPIRPVVDPEYQEWLQFKKETDPEFIKWKEAKKAKKKEAERKREEDEKRRIKSEQRKQRLLLYDHAKIQIYIYETKLKKIKEAIDAINKWRPIIKQLITAGKEPVSFHLGNHKISEYMFSYVERFIVLNCNNLLDYVNHLEECMENMKIAIDNKRTITMKKQDERCKSILDDLNKEYKTTQIHIQYVYKYLEVLTENLLMSKDLSTKSIFEINLKIRKNYKNYWEKYKWLYEILEPFFDTWNNDIHTIYLNAQDDSGSEFYKKHLDDWDKN